MSDGINNLLISLANYEDQESNPHLQRLLFKARTKIDELANSSRPKVKALDWTDASWKEVPEVRTTNAICHYSVFYRPDDRAWGVVRWKSSEYDENEVLGHRFISEDQAKAAAQSHYEKLILEALE